MTIKKPKQGMNSFTDMVSQHYRDVSECLR